MTNEEIIRMAREAGFEEYDCGLSGNSELDEMLYVGEYPIGEAVFKLVVLVAEATKEKAKQLVLDDAYALTFQRFGQYRTALAKEIGELK
jgi:hypothetical protein